MLEPTLLKLSQQRALTERVSHSIDISVCEIGDCLKGGTSLASLRSARSVPGFVVQIFVFCRCVSKGGTSLASLRSARSVPGYVVQIFVFCRCVSEGGTSLASLRSARSVPGYVVQIFVFMFVTF